MAFKLNLDLNFKDVSLDQLTTEAKKGSSIDLSNKITDVAKNYGTNSTNAYGGTSDSRTETVDLTSAINKSENSTSPIDNTQKQDSPFSESAIEKSTSSLTFGTEGDTTPTAQSRTTATSKAASSSSSKTSIDETQQIFGDRKPDTEKTLANSESEIKTGQSNKMNFDRSFSTNDTHKTSTTSNVGSSMMMNARSDTSKNEQNANNMNFDMSNQKDASDASAGQQIIENLKVFYTKGKNVFDKVASTVTENYEMAMFIASYEVYGFRKEDIMRIYDGKISASELFAEIQNDKEDNSRRREMMYASYLQAYETDFYNMDDFQKDIDEDKVKLVELHERKRNVDNHEYSSLLDILLAFRNGQNLDTLLRSTPIAWEYTDEKGEKCYRYDDPYASGMVLDDVTYVPKTYEEMYGTDRLEELFELTETTYTPLFSNETKTTHIWQETDEQVAYYNEILEEFDRRQKECNDMLDGIDSRIESLENKIATNEYIYSLIEREVEYYMNFVDPYTIKEDFAENSQFATSSTSTIDEIRRQAASAIDVSTYSDARAIQTFDVTINGKDQLVDVIACLLNGHEVTYLSSNFINSDDSLLHNYKKWYSLAGETEVSIFNYIYNTQGKDAAYTYLQDISDELDIRWLAKKTQEDEEFASAHPVLASAASVVVTPIEGMSAIAFSLNARINSERIRRSDVYSSGDVWRAKVATDIANNHGEGWSFIYSTGMSMVDSASLIALTAATGGTAAPALSATLMGSRAYVSTLNDALDRGLADSDAVLLAAVSGVVETAMESYSVGHLLNLEEKLGKGTLSMASKIADRIENPVASNLITKTFYIGAGAVSQGLAEGEEEFATEILNYAADRFIAKDLSNYTQSIERYLSLGYTEEEAGLNTMKDFSNQASMAFLGGFVSGICFGTFGGSLTTAKTSNAIAENMYASLEGITPGQQFASALEINRAQMNDYSNVLNKYKNNEALTLDEIELFQEGTVEMQSAKNIKDKLFKKSIPGTLNSKNNEVEIVNDNKESKTPDYSIDDYNHLKLSDEEIQAKMDEYNALLESNEDLKIILANEQKGYTVRINDDVLDDYKHLKRLKYEIVHERSASVDETIDQMMSSQQNTIEQHRYDARTMPLSEDSLMRTIQEKILSGVSVDELSFSEKMKLGRDTVVREIDGYQLKPDCVYRVITKELYDLYVKEGYVMGLDEADEYDPNQPGNRGVDWYLGGACLKYGKGSKVGKVVIECPATTEYFVPTHDNGSGMAKDPMVRHMKSSGYAHPVPMSMIKVIMHPDSSMMNNDIRNIQTHASLDTQMLDAQMGKFNPLILDIINENNSSSDDMTQYVSDLVDDAIDIPEGYDSLESYKRDFTRTLIESQTIDTLTNGTVFVMTKDSVMLEELIGCKKLINLLVKNLKNPNFQSDLVDRLSSCSLHEFDTVFADDEMIQFLNNMTVDELGALLKTFGRRNCSYWLANEAFVNKVINLEIDDFYKVIKDAGYAVGNLKKILTNGEGERAYAKFLDAVLSKFYTEDIILEDLSKKKVADNILVGKFGIDEQIAEKIRSINTIAENIDNRLKDSLTEHSDIAFVRDKFRFGIEVTGQEKYYDVTFEIDGKEETKTLSSSSGLIDIEYTFISKPQYAKYILEGKLKITAISVNAKKSNLVLTSEQGLGKGLNEVVMLVDGKEYKLIINSIYDEKDLNYESNETLQNAKTIEIVSVTNIGSLNETVEDNEALYKVTLNVDGTLRETYMTTPDEYKSLKLDDHTLNIDGLIAENNLVGVTGVSVEQVDLNDIKRNLPRIQDYKSSRDIFVGNKYGGNQSDVTSILKAALYKEQQSSLDIRKADLLNSLIEKYFPQATDIQKVNIAKHYASGGCCWMATANAFMTYIGNLENGSNIFKEKIGFDMAFHDGDALSYNLEAMAFDMYLSYHAKKYDGNVDALCEFKQGGGVNWSTVEPKLADYFKERGISFLIRSKKNGNITTRKLRNSLLGDIINNKNGFNILAADTFDIKLIDGKATDSSDDVALRNAKKAGLYEREVGGHAMLVTDITDELNLLVSSWSRKYEFLPESIAEYKAKGKSPYAEIWSIAFDIPDAVIPNITQAETAIDENSSIELMEANSEKTLELDPIDLGKTLEDIDIDDDEIRKQNKQLLDRLRKSAPVAPVRQLSDLEIIIKKTQYDKLMSNASVADYMQGSVFRIDENLAEKINLAEKLAEEISQKVGSVTSADIELVQKIKENEKSNLQLKADILKKTEHIFDAFGKARALYIELGKSLNYDMNYRYGNRVVEDILKNQNVTFATLNAEHKVICKGWAELYRELLIESGFDERDVTIKGNGHYWVEIAMGDNILIADATDNMDSGIDLAFIKAGMATKGFILMPKTYSGIRLNIMYKQGTLTDSVLDSYNKSLLRIDKNIGYAIEKGYLIDQLNKSKRLFGNAKLFDKIFKKNDTKETIREFMNRPIPENMDGYEVFAYYKTVFKNILSEEQYANLRFQNLEHEIPSDGLYVLEKNIESVFVMSYTNEDGTVTRYAYSKNIGFHVLEGEDAFGEFLEKYDI